MTKIGLGDTLFIIIELKNPSTSVPKQFNVFSIGYGVVKSTPEFFRWSSG